MIGFEIIEKELNFTIWFFSIMSVIFIIVLHNFNKLFPFKNSHSVFLYTNKIDVVWITGTWK